MICQEGSPLGYQVDIYAELDTVLPKVGIAEEYVERISSVYDTLRLHRLGANVPGSIAAELRSQTDQLLPLFKKVALERSQA